MTKFYDLTRFCLSNVLICQSYTQISRGNTSLGYKYKITFVTKLVRGSVILKTVKFGTSGSTGIISRPNIELSGTQTHSYENIIKSTGDYNPSKIEFQFDSTVSNPRGV